MAEEPGMKDHIVWVQLPPRMTVHWRGRGFWRLKVDVVTEQTMVSSSL